MSIDETGRQFVVASTDRDFARLLCQALAPAGVASAVSSSSDLFSRTHAMRPAAIVLEPELFGLGGDAACKNLRALDSTKLIPAIFILRSEEDVHQLASFRPERDRFLVKPFRLEAFEQALDEVLVVAEPAD